LPSNGEASLGGVSWEVEFYGDDAGRYPAREFLDGLDPVKRAAMIAAVEVILVARGLDVCATEYGRHLGEGLFEFRVRHDEHTTRAKAGEVSADRGARSEVLLRLFCHAYGERIVLLLGGYDKGADPSGRRQSREIETARKRLRSFKLRLRRERAAAKRRA
jgi:hypothetical protein